MISVPKNQQVLEHVKMTSFFLQLISYRQLVFNHGIRSYQFGTVIVSSFPSLIAKWVDAKFAAQISHKFCSQSTQEQQHTEAHQIHVMGRRNFWFPAAECNLALIIIFLVFHVFLSGWWNWGTVQVCCVNVIYGYLWQMIWEPFVRDLSTFDHVGRYVLAPRST